MAGIRALPRWVSTTSALALIAALLLSFSVVYIARGDSHDQPLYACLFAGSLSQVGPNEPANCGRGSMVTVSGGVGAAGINTTVARTGQLFDDGGFGRDATVTWDGVAGEYTIVYGPDVFRRFDGAGGEDLPALNLSTATGQPLATRDSVAWALDGTLTFVVSAPGGVTTQAQFSVVQHLPADATFTAP